MIYLLAASLLWAFSFGLIKYNLAGIDANVIALVRLFLSFLVFVPLLRPRRGTRGLWVRLVLIGAVQYGIMYMAYIASYRYLKAYEVAFFTIFTPLYVVVVNDLSRRRFHGIFFVAAIVAVCGAAAICYPAERLGRAGAGVLILQLANLCFAAGQVAYKLVKEKHAGIRDAEVFGALFGGAVLVTLGPAAWTLLAEGAPALAPVQVLTLLYLGVVPSGIAFFLWNKGATRTNAGTLSAMNNAKIPLGVLASVVCFGEQIPLGSVVAGGLLIGLSVALAEAFRRRQKHGGNVA